MPSRKGKKKAEEAAQPIVTNPEELPEYQPPTSTAIIPAPITMTKAEVSNFLANLRVATFDNEVELFTQLLRLPNEGDQGRIKAYGMLELARSARAQIRKFHAFLGEIVNTVHEGKLFNLIADDEGIKPTEQSFWTDGVGIPWDDVHQLITFKREIAPALETVGIDPDEFWQKTNKTGLQVARQEIRDVRKQAGQPNTAAPNLEPVVKAELHDRLTDLMDKPEAEIRAMKRDEKGGPTRYGIPGTLNFVQVGTEVRGRVTFEITLQDIIAFQQSQAYWHFLPRINGQPIDWDNVQEMQMRQQTIVDDGGSLQTVQLVQPEKVVDAGDDFLAGLDDLDDFGDYVPQRPIELTPATSRLSKSA